MTSQDRTHKPIPPGARGKAAGQKDRKKRPTHDGQKPVSPDLEPVDSTRGPPVVDGLIFQPVRKPGPYVTPCSGFVYFVLGNSRIFWRFTLLVCISAILMTGASVALMAAGAHFHAELTIGVSTASATVLAVVTRVLVRRRGGKLGDPDQSPSQN